MKENLEIAVFGGGCFWCTEALFKSLKGIHTVTSGYAGGTAENATYEKVSGGNTDHAEVIKIEFDPDLISFGDLLAVFFNTHDPTTLNRQGADSGTQYRSVIFYASDAQKQEAEKLIEELTINKAYDNPIVTKIEPLTEFYPAEEYHKDYYERNKDAPYCEIVIAPKLEKLEKRFRELLKNA